MSVMDEGTACTTLLIRPKRMKASRNHTAAKKRSA